MKRATIHAPGDVRLDEVAVPEPGPHDAVVRVQACGICGSDLGYIKVGGVGGPSPHPVALGHEFSAVIDRVGAEVAHYRPGMRVVVNPLASGNIGNGGDQGAFSREVLVTGVDSGKALFAIPDDLPFDRAALAEPLGVGMQAVNRADLSPGDKVVIFGAGPIGLMALATLRYRGFADVAIVDMSSHRLAIAEELGAALTLDPSAGDLWQRLQNAHGTSMFLDVLPMTASDAYIEASGAASVIPEIIANARPGCRISVVALHRQPIPVDFMMVMAKQMTIAGSMAYPDDYGEMVRMLAEIDLSPVITHHFPLADFERALAVASDPASAGKVIVEP